MSGTGMDGVVMNWVCAWLFSNLGHHAFKRYHQGIASSWPGVLRPSSAWCGPRLTSSWWSLGENLQTADLLGIEILNSCATFWVPTFRERKCDVWQLVSIGTPSHLGSHRPTFWPSWDALPLAFVSFESSKRWTCKIPPTRIAQGVDKDVVVFFWDVSFKALWSFLLFTDHWACRLSCVFFKRCIAKRTRGLCRTYPQSAFDGRNGACGGGTEEAILGHFFWVGSKCWLWFV